MPARDPLMVVLGVALVVLATGCEPRLVVGAACDLSSDCPAPLVCRLGRCRVECREQRDCAGAELCLELATGLGVCRLPDEPTCASDDDCAGALACSTGRRTTACALGGCGVGATCISGGCVRTDDDAGVLEEDARSSGRVERGLVTALELDEESGMSVADTSGALVLTIADDTRTVWRPGALEILPGARVSSATGSAQVVTLVEAISDERPWAGNLHRVAIYSEALTPEELATNLAAGSE